MELHHSTKSELTNLFLDKDLEKTVIIEINIKFKIITNPSNTNAQFFAEFRSIKKSFTVAINVDSLDNLGKKQQYNINNDIAWRPLVDLYINQLRKYSQKEYLRLAGYAFE